MIFITVGSLNFSFKRFIQSIDDAIETGYITDPVFGQIGESTYCPKNFEYRKFLELDEFSRIFSSADMIISHAGVGTIMNAIKLQKPIIVCPRLKLYNEHVNDHQLQTAKKFEESGVVSCIYNFKDLSIYKAKMVEAKKLCRKTDLHPAKELSNDIYEYIETLPIFPKEDSNE